MKTDIMVTRIPLDTPEGLQAATEALCRHMALLPEPRRLVAVTTAATDLLLFFELFNQ